MEDEFNDDYNDEANDDEGNVTFGNALEDLETGKSLAPDEDEEFEDEVNPDSENEEDKIEADLIDDEDEDVAPLKVVAPVEKAQITNIVPRAQRTLAPVMTEFEYEAIIKRRATELVNNATPLLPKFDIRTLQNPVRIAQRELDEGYLGNYTINRAKPGGRIEAWEVKELLLPKWSRRRK